MGWTQLVLMLNTQVLLLSFETFVNSSSKYLHEIMVDVLVK
jgi:hypothetical protein